MCTMKKAFFLDRDGTLNVEVDYLYRCEDFALIDGALEAVRRIHEAGFLAVVVSNQAGIARGKYTLNDVKKLEKYMCEVMGKADPMAVPDGFYYCPHHPSKGTVPELVKECSCRKPSPGMLLQAQKELKIDLASSYMIGDKLSDVEAGIRAGCRESIFVKTGHGLEEVEQARNRNYPVCDDLLQAVKRILSK